MIMSMGRDPTERTTPDVFPTATFGDASAPSTKLPAAEATTETTPQRHILPKDLPNVGNPVQCGHRFQRKADSNPVIADSR
jgi:hypothetical protein